MVIVYRDIIGRCRLRTTNFRLCSMRVCNVIDPSGEGIGGTLSPVPKTRSQQKQRV